jgi:hypothetical protein
MCPFSTGEGEGGTGWERHPGSPSEVGSVRAAHVTGAGGASTNETSSARSRGNAASAAPPGASGNGVASAAIQSTYLNRMVRNGISVQCRALGSEAGCGEAAPS